MLDTQRCSIPKGGPSKDYLFSIHWPLRSQLLVFYTTSAHFPVARTCDLDSSNDGNRFGLYTILGSPDSEPAKSHDTAEETLPGEVLEGSNTMYPEASSIYLNKNWRARQPESLEFILIQTKTVHGTLSLETMLIERIGNLAYRVNLPTSPFSELAWETQKPTGKWIYLA
ncbi:uncharacterized protein BDZ99DRAFT_465083 [Mytilinidion resinicola]|uniref:Uncharacterized protein n=1 Tax=Mytilinidion resinicola TaxID=574789 RepID=A0A6A6YEA5_9PEZI|nr:uncharacterized protein BDZ99DRAFT_465083 [Mytilinidion resinicola]KAF2807151.1 hypothetical protein BDZ99DRAFT_465083 [Mytilinidion resinicola]